MLLAAALFALVCVAVAAVPPSPSVPSIAIIGSWQVRVTYPDSEETTLQIAPPTRIKVTAERYDTLKPFDEKAAPWARGTRLRELVTFETTAPDMLVVESLRLKSGPAPSPVLTRGVDYQLEPRWATVGSLPGGKATGVPVFADYEIGRGRIDSIVQDAKGRIVLRQGVSDNATPHPPTLAVNERRLANIRVRGRASQLMPSDIFPIIETAFPATPGPASAQKLLPKTWAKLTKSGAGKLRILAWGDSVTAGGQVSDKAHQYQEQFVARLRRRFPAADIELMTVAWGGRNTASFLAEPPGSPYNFQEKVLDARPDLIVMEFVNDSGLTSEQIEERYGGLRTRFREIGAEWIILTPHLVWGEWMGTGIEKVEKDPRPYVAGLHQFVARRAGEPGLALADGSARWAHLVKEGIPYETLLCNCLNHPDDRGHALFADALMALFEGE
jgi:hypothetical protein